MLGALVLTALTQLDGGAPVGAGLEAARALLGTPYEWGGRLRTSREGLDCMGVVLAAAEAASGCGWRSYSGKPTELVAQRVWGSPVPGLAPIATAQLELDRLEAGDVLLLVGLAPNPAEPAIATLDGVGVWVWHVGLYVGEGAVLVGDHHAGQTVVTPLLPYLRAHTGEYAGLFVLRGPAARPPRCRRHPPLTWRQPAKALK